MGNQFDSGIGRSAREQFTPGQPTPDSGFQSLGMHMGMVVDDIDEAKSGRVWVYIPGISARNNDIEYARYSTAREPPNDDGTPGAPIMAKRAGFIQAYPLKSHAGSDRLREKPNQSDGRNPNIGQSNSYGDFHQARNGDQLMVCFASGDPSRCFIMGHIPKTGETDMVPGHTPEKTDSSGAGTSTNVGPGYELPDGETQTKPASVLFNNLTDAGLISDPLRGGTNSSTRESPSRVRGSKTPGDPDTAMAGHHFVMDDHPDTQLVRTRTSKGMQVLLSDTGDFMYLNTATGKVWIEADDAGQLHVFSHSSVSIHTEEDFNFVCDRDFNLHVAGNYNCIVKGDTRIRMSGGGNITVGEGGGDLDITTINNLHIKSQKEIRMGAKTGITAKSADFMTMQSAKDMKFKSAQDFHTDTKTTNLKSSEAITVQSGNDTQFKSGGKFNVAASGSAQLQSSGQTNIKGSSIQLDAPSINSSVQIVVGGSAGDVSVSDVGAVDDGKDPNQADIPLEHSVASPPTTSGPPVSPTGLTKYAAPVVPQHEPWMGHRSQNPGHDAAMEPSSIPKLL